MAANASAYSKRMTTPRSECRRFTWLGPPIMSFDHVTLVTMTDEGPSIANLKLEGILDKTGHIPLDGDNLCFQASGCKTESP